MLEIKEYRVEVAFDVTASSPAMAIRKLLNAMSTTNADPIIAAYEADPDDEAGWGRGYGIALDDPRLIASRWMGVVDVREADDYADVAQSA